MRRRRLLLLLSLVLLGVIGTWWWIKEEPLSTDAPRQAGTPLDSLNGVVVYDNAGMGNVSGRNVVDGYNVGLRYQCVEFVKRYYLEHYDHRMPNSYGHAKDLFDRAIADGHVNADRALVQFTNPSASMPAVGDLVVMDGWKGNPYGHVAIVSKVADGEVEVVQQNTGSTRGTYDLEMTDGRWRIDSKRVLGWLRKGA